MCMKSQRLRIQECSPRPSPPPRYRSDSNSRLPNIQGSPRVLAAPRIVRVNGPLLRTAPQRFTTPSCGGFDAGEDVPKQSELQSNAEHYVKPPRSPSSLQSIASKVHMADSIETFPDVENKIKKKKQHCTLLINKIPYMRLDCIGKGGSSRVFRVLTGSGKVLALKRVSLKDMGPSTIQGYKGEIDLLRQLSNVDRAVNLIDWELDCQKSTLSLVCYCRQYCPSHGV